YSFQVSLSSILILLIGVPILTRRHSHLAGLYFLTLSNATVFFFCNWQGIDSGTYIFFFPLFFALAWLMDFRKPWYNFALIFITLITVTLVILFPVTLFGLTITPEQREASFTFNVITAAVIMGANTLVIAWLSFRQHKELETKISEKQKASEELSVALKEKDILLAEIHHRVKNNLAVVRSLLNLQMNTTTNDIARATLRESMNRVSSMALIHQKLYSTKKADAIDFGNYASDLVREISSSYVQDGYSAPQVNVDVDDTELDLNKAVPCGLILNELLSNAFKHAFEKDRPGTIHVSIGRAVDKPGNTRLVVKDNGKGIAADIHPEEGATLGLTIIYSLSDQLDGSFAYNGTPGQGTTATLIFPSV
ncbi:MAG TPA: sensor histidine kinase, partial [Bacteroidia bacterium]|nr:sensor histidine kinase [Bacteroidia bacterium]